MAIRKGARSVPGRTSTDSGPGRHSRLVFEAGQRAYVSEPRTGHVRSPWDGARRAKKESSVCYAAMVLWLGSSRLN